MRLEDVKDFKQFLEDEKAVWARKLEEIEMQFFSSEQELQLPSTSPQKKRSGRGKELRADQSMEENFEMARLAAFEFLIFSRLFKNGKKLHR